MAFMPKTSAPTRPAEPASNEERLIDAAMRCVEKYGVKKTFLDDIAVEAALSRRTAYRIFGSRKALLEKIAARIVDSLSTQVRMRSSRYESVEDALVLGAVEGLQTARANKLFMSVLEALGDEGLERYLLDPKGPAFAYTRRAFADTFARAREQDVLRPDASDDELTLIMVAANCIFLLREDMDKKEQVNFLRKFLLPAILRRG